MCVMIRRTIIFLCFILQFNLVYGQLSFCEGDLGDPIFTEDFGTGTMNGPALDASVTTYTYVDSGQKMVFIPYRLNYSNWEPFIQG